MRNTLILTLAGMAAVSLIACSDDIQPGRVSTGAPQTVKARVATVHLQTRPFIYEAVGTTIARNSSTISSTLMGTVKEVRAKEGDIVKEGDILVVLDQRQVAAQYEGAQAALAEARNAQASAQSARDAAKAAAELARSTYERYLQLLKENSVSQQEFDEVAARHRQAEATLTQTTAMLEAAGHRVQQAQAGLDSAGVGKKDAVIRAPYGARVTAKMIDVGDLASPGTPFFTLEKEGVYCVDLVLPEEHIESVTIGQQVEVTIPALNNAVMEGRIGRIVPSADQKSRSFQIKVGLAENPAIRSGLFARVGIPVGKSGTLQIPVAAVVDRGQLTGIFQVDDKGILHFRLIRTGKRTGDLVEVVSGLQDGDRYVVEPSASMADGMKVEVSS